MMNKKIVFLTGAGISAESGVKTFRDYDGLWEGHSVEEVATLDGWEKDKQKVLDFYNERRRQLGSVEPNLAHKLIGDLEKDYDISIITQNVDDLHERGGSTKVMHLHGELLKMCSSMDKEKTLPYNDDIKVGDKHSDGSQLRPYIVWFGEDVTLIDDAVEEVKTADILVIIGTSLEVYPAAGLMGYAKSNCDLYYIDPKPKMSSGVAKYFTVIKKVATEGVKEFIDILKK
jgi:NAD-dependent deacetylase